MLYKKNLHEHSLNLSLPFPRLFFSSSCKIILTLHVPLLNHVFSLYISSTNILFYLFISLNDLYPVKAISFGEEHYKLCFRSSPFCSKDVVLFVNKCTFHEHANKICLNQMKVGIGCVVTNDYTTGICFFQGTTGFPKGATLSHHNIVNNSYFIGIRLDYHNRVSSLLLNLGNSSQAVFILFELQITRLVT